MPILAIYLQYRLWVISFHLGSIFWKEYLKGNNKNRIPSSLSAEVHSSIFKSLEKTFIVPATMVHCFWRILVSGRAEREKTKKAAGETESRQEFFSFQTIKWCCLTYDVNEASGHLSCSFIFVSFKKVRIHMEVFLLKSTHYRKQYHANSKALNKTFYRIMKEG